MQNEAARRVRLNPNDKRASGQSLNEIEGGTIGKRSNRGNGMRGIHGRSVYGSGGA